MAEAPQPSSKSSRRAHGPAASGDPGASSPPRAGVGEEPAGAEDPSVTRIELPGCGGWMELPLLLAGGIAWAASGVTVLVNVLLVVSAIAFAVWLVVVVALGFALRGEVRSAWAEPITPRGQPLLPGFDAPGPVAALLDEAALVPASAWACAHGSLARSARRDHLRAGLLPLAVLVVLFGGPHVSSVNIPGPAALLLGAASLAYLIDLVIWGVANRLEGPRLFIGKVVDRDQGGPKGDDWVTNAVNLFAGRWAPTLTMQISVQLGIGKTRTLYRHRPPAGDRIIQCQRKLWKQVKDDDVVAVLAASSGRAYLQLSDLTSAR